MKITVENEAVCAEKWSLGFGWCSNSRIERVASKCPELGAMCFKWPGYLCVWTESMMRFGWSQRKDEQFVQEPFESVVITQLLQIVRTDTRFLSFITVV